MAGSEEKLEALLKDLNELANYLHGRGERSLAMSRKFEDHAQRDKANKEYDLSQAKMLDYQHHIWHEIGNLIDKIIKQYDK